jgi:hypothetical protein
VLMAMVLVLWLDTWHLMMIGHSVAGMCSNLVCVLLLLLLLLQGGGDLK